MQAFRVTPGEIAGQQALNRRLARLPRLGVDGRARRALVRSALWAGAIGADAKLRRQGLAVSRLNVDHEGRALRFRVICPAGPVHGIVLDIHGGAWAFGNPAMDDLSNAAIAQRAGAIVVSLDYALALPRPVAALQAEAAAALAWLLTASASPDALPDLSPDLPIAVTGESAGAHLVLGAVLAARDAGADLSRVRGMLLHCGAYDLGGSPSALAADATTLVLHGASLPRQLEILFPGRSPQDLRHPATSPLFADLSGLPAAMIVVGDIDPLRDDSRLLAARIEAVGGEATLVELPHAPHAIIHLPGAYADRVRDASAQWLRDRLRPNDAR